MYGEWLAQKLKAEGIQSFEPIAEDFAWLVPIQARPYRLYVACSNAEERPDEWRVFVFIEGGRLSKLFGRDRSAQRLDFVFAAVKRVLESSGMDKLMELADR